MEIEIKLFQKIFKELLEGKSLRNIEKEYKVDRNTIVKECRTLFPEGSEEAKKFEKILEYNKNNNISITIKEEDMKEIADKLFCGNITVEQAYTTLKIDRLTFKEKLIKYAIDSDRIREYVEYEAKSRPDYSHINFKALLIKMIETESSQVEISKEYGIPSRTIGREIEKLKKDEYYHDLYTLCKEQASRKMEKKEFSEFEREVMNRLLEEKYDEGSIIVENPKTREEQEYERAVSIVKIADDTPGTLKQKANKAGVSESTLRRMKILIKNYKEKEKAIQSEVKGEE